MTTAPAHSSPAGAGDAYGSGDTVTGPGPRPVTAQAGGGAAAPAEARESARPTDGAGRSPGVPAGAAATHRHSAHTWQEARELAFNSATPIPAVPVALREALGRILAEDVTALQDMAHYASSAMDGWAVNGSGPWILVEPGERLAAHQASPIVTGGLLPPGAKAVLRSESGTVAMGEDGLPVLRTGGMAKPGEPHNGQHIRKAAEEAAAGDLLIKAGALLNPAHLALAALAGHDTLPVLGKAVVRLVLTGSEVIPAGLPGPGEVRDVFAPQLAAVVGMLGGICTAEIKIGDSYAEWLAALSDSADGAEGPAGPSAGNRPADVVVTTGGTGASGTDHFRRAVAELGGELLIDGVAMRPGHPAVLAKLPDSRFILGLPGNPLAAMMALSTIGAPLLAALGHSSLPPVAEVSCGVAIDADPGRTRLMPFRLLCGMASPAQHTGPGMMRGLAAADGVLVVPPEGVQLGDLVAAFALPWGPPIPTPGLAAAPTATAADKPDRIPATGAGPADWCTPPG